MIRYFILVCCLCCCLGCKEVEKKMPLEEEQMVALLSDMHIAEAILQTVPSIDRDSLGKVYYRIIYNTHGVKEGDFTESMAILREDPLQLEAIYTRVVEDLATREAENQAEITESEQIIDSLKAEK